MTVEITRWQPLFHDGNAVASFNFRVGGVSVRAVMLQRTAGGFRVTMPFTRHKQDNGKDLIAVGLDYDLLQEVTAAAEDHYQRNGNRWSYAKTAATREREELRADVVRMVG